jgi:hypothetical protein
LDVRGRRVASGLSRIASGGPQKAPGYRDAKRKALLLGLTLLPLAGAAALALTVVAPHSAQKPLAFTPPILGAPPPNSFVLAREAGDLAVALAVQPRRSTATLVATVLGRDGSGLSGLDVTFALRTATGAHARGTGRGCGPGCYEATLTGIAGRPAAATVQLSGEDLNESSTFALPKAWPPAPATELVQRATAAYRRLRTLVIHERLASDVTHALTTVYRAAAPNRLRLTSSTGTQAIIIGSRRWDRTPGQPWRESQQSPIRSVIPFWVTTPVNPYLLGSDTVAGRAVWVVSFVTPQVPAWFTAWIDKKTHRTLELRMTAAAHFMHHRYGPFNAPLRISPPR